MFNLSAIVLAAGLSRRAAPHNKLLLPHGETTVVRSTVSAMCDAGCREVVVVTGHQREKVESALGDLPARFVFNEFFAEGMGHSLAAGVRAAIMDTTGFLVTPGDLPELRGDLVKSIAQRFIDEACGSHVIPTAFGKRGHPVAIGKWLRNDLCSLSGDVGARGLLAAETEEARTLFLEVSDQAILRDIDHRA